MSKKLFLLIITLTIAIGILSPVLVGVWAEGSKTVYIIPVKGEITPAMATFFKKVLRMQKALRLMPYWWSYLHLEDGADAALDMKEAIEQSEIPVIVYITDRAVSAGALIAIAAPRIIMAPGSHMGSAEPIPYSAKGSSSY